VAARFIGLETKDLDRLRWVLTQIDLHTATSDPQVGTCEAKQADRSINYLRSFGRGDRRRVRRLLALVADAET
jgi:hypothetical protein